MGRRGATPALTGEEDTHGRVPRHPRRPARIELRFELEDQFAVVFTDDDVSGWRSVVDLYRSIVARSGVPVDAVAVWPRLVDLLAVAYRISPAMIGPNAELFSDPLRLQDRDSSGWANPDTSALAAMAPLPDLKDIDAQIERLTREKEAAVVERDFEKAAGLREQADTLRKWRNRITRPADDRPGGQT